MTIKKRGCRAADRTRMKKMHMQGYNVNQISNAISVVPELVEEVLSGSWDEKETANAKRQQERDRERLTGIKEAEQNRIAQIAAAAAHAIKGTANDPIMDQDELRKQIEAEVRAEIAKEEPELTRGQKAAATRKANMEAKEAEAAAAQAIDDELADEAEDEHAA